MHKQLLIVAIILGFASQLRGEDPIERAKRAIDSARVKFQNSVARHDEALTVSLGQLESTLQRSGDAAQLETVRIARREFLRTGKLPDSIPLLSYRKQMTISLEKYLEAFEKEKSVLTRKGSLAGASMINQLAAEATADFNRTHPNVRLYRTKWVHNVGCFEQVNGREWIEYTDHGRNSFVEISRTPESVTLIDQSRKLQVTLTDSNSFIQSEKGNCKLLYNGHWAN